MKKLFNFNKKTIVATCYGVVLFTLFFRYVKVPTGFPEVSIQTAYGIGAFFAALLGPIGGAFVAFMGHTLSDVIQFGPPCWSWVIASGVAMYITGLSSSKINIHKGEFTIKDVIVFNIYQVVGNLLAWCLIAPGLDILIYGENALYAFEQGVWASLPNKVSAGVIGSVVLGVYSRIRAKDKRD